MNDNQNLTTWEVTSLPVELRRLERPTYCLQGNCSSQLSYSPMCGVYLLYSQTLTPLFSSASTGATRPLVGHQRLER